MAELDIALDKIKVLVEDFRKEEHYYKSPSYTEAQARKDFIDKLWIVLGWDVNHETQTNPYEQEVKVERTVVTGETQRRADYSFCLAPNHHDIKFLVEAKKPAVEVATAENYFQIIRYGWNSNTPLAVITDFEQFHIIDCRYRPDMQTALSRAVGQYQYTDYLNRDKFAEIYWLFSREAVAEGSIEKRAKELPKPRGRAVPRGLLPGGDQRIDEAFLSELDEHRLALARAFKKCDPGLKSDALTEISQRTLDRLVFLRFLEDRGIEATRIVENFGQSGNAWGEFIATCRKLDKVYNGVVYKEHGILDNPALSIDDRIFGHIRDRLSHAISPYDFNSIPIHILGSIYERFLGKVIVATAKRARVEEKLEVRKAGGVYYTPEYIVRYIVQNTVGKLIDGKTPDQIAEMRFADIACGSGSFLLGVFDLLLTYHGQYYNDNPRKARKGDCIKRGGELFLTLKKKREILTNNIYGVDIDAQAVEVCQLSLYLRLLQEETEATTQQYRLDLDSPLQKKQLLPDLSKNIVCGNSLIDWDIEQDLFGDEERKLNPMSFDTVFPEIMRRGGFDAIVGNPPYRMLQPHNTTSKVIAYLRSRYPSSEFKMEFFHMFLQRAVTLLANRGYLSYIIPTTLLNNVYAGTLRTWLSAKCCIQQIAIATGRVFANADVHTSVVVFVRENSRDLRENNVTHTTTLLSPDFAAHHRWFGSTSQRVFADLPGGVWNILVNDANAPIIRRLSQEYHSLAEVATINRGLITGDRAGFFASHKRSSKYVPILAGKDVHRYFTDKPSEYVLFERPKSAGGCWDPAVHFASHKLVIRQIGERASASFVDEPIAVTGNIFTVRSGDRRQDIYLLGLINSRLLDFFWRIMFTDFKQSFPQVTIFSLSQLPIKALDRATIRGAEHHNGMVRYVEHRLEAGMSLAVSQTDRDNAYYENKCAALDRQIDQLVYELYELTDKEIAIVEGNS